MERPGAGGKGLEAAEKRRLQKENENGLTYQIWFDRRRYNYIDYEIGHGNVEVGFTCIIKQGDDRLYSFKNRTDNRRFILSDADRGPAAEHRAAGHLSAPAQSPLPRLYRPL